jgi:hypothetical protein
VNDPLRHEGPEVDAARQLATTGLPPEEVRGTADEIPAAPEPVEPEVAAAITSAADDARELEFADSDTSPRTLSSEIGLRVVAGLVALAAWAVPGLGHIIARRWVRGLVFSHAPADWQLLDFCCAETSLRNTRTIPSGRSAFWPTRGRVSSIFFRVFLRRRGRMCPKPLVTTARG